MLAIVITFTPHHHARHLSAASQVHSLRQGIAWHRSKTWHWQDIAGRTHTPTDHAELHTHSLAYLAWIEHLWSQRRIAARKFAAQHPAIAHMALWLCIHRGEGAWSDEDSGGSGHYGGLQMTLGWDGLVGNAALLSPYEQMRAAETGYQRSGYSRAWLEGQWGETIGPCWGYA